MARCLTTTNYIKRLISILILKPSTKNNISLRAFFTLKSTNFAINLKIRKLSSKLCLK